MLDGNEAADDPTRFYAEARVFGLDNIQAILLAGEIAVTVENPFANLGSPIRAHLGLDPKDAKRFGEWLIAAARVSEDLEKRRL